MSIHGIWMAYCDSRRDDCPYGEDRATEDTDALSRANLVSKMRENGWRFMRGNKHWCPDCVANAAADATE